eukprot:4026832-Alexandrium_andersonii.AAC.1
MLLAPAGVLRASSPGGGPGSCAGPGPGAALRLAAGPPPLSVREEVQVGIQRCPPPWRPRARSRSGPGGRRPA